MEEKRYIFNISARIQRGFISATTHLLAWAFVLIGFFLGDSVADVVLMSIGLGGMAALFLVGFFSGTSLVLTSTEVAIEDKKQGWVSFPYNQYHIELTEYKRSYNFFTLYVTRKIKIYSLANNQLVYTASVFNIPSKEFKKLEWLIRDLKGVPTIV